MWAVNETVACEQWKTSALALLGSVLGEDSVHYTRFAEATIGWDKPHVQRGIGILQAAVDDILGGHLKRAKQLAFAEVFSDFLDMADHLLETGYKDPAASLYGAILENGLKKTAEAKSVAFDPKAGMGPLNDKLAAAGVYNPIIKSDVNAVRVMRNAADHGDWNAYDADQARDMGRKVRDILGRLL